MTFADYYSIGLADFPSLGPIKLQPHSFWNYWYANKRLLVIKNLVLQDLS